MRNKCRKCWTRLLDIEDWFCDSCNSISMVVFLMFFIAMSIVPIIIIIIAKNT